MPRSHQHGVSMTRSKLPKRQDHKVMGFAKFDLASREDVEAAGIQCTGSRTGKELGMVDTFMNHLYRPAPYGPQQTRRPPRSAEQTVVLFEMRPAFDSGVFENTTAHISDAEEPRRGRGEVVPHWGDRPYRAGPQNGLCPHKF